MKFEKRLMAFALACLIMIGFVPPVTAQAAGTKFADVPSTHKNYNAITFLYNNGIINGLSETNFGADTQKNINSKANLIDREDFVLILYRMAGEPAVSGTCKFTDVKKGSYYYNAVLWAQQKNITQGVSTTRFGVNSKLTYEQVLTFLRRFAEKAVTLDANKMTTRALPSYFKKYNSSGNCPEMITAVAWACNQGLIKGLTSTHKEGSAVVTSVYRGNKECTRQDLAQLVYNFYKNFRKVYALVGNTGDALVDEKDYTPNTAKGYSFNHEVKENLIPLLKGYCTSESTFKTFKDLDTVDNKNRTDDFTKIFDNAFKKANCIDLCYFYINAHGDEGAGIRVVDEHYADPNSPGKFMREHISPSELFDTINKYQGKFVVMLEVCYSGMFVDYFNLKEAAGEKGTAINADIIAAAAANKKSAAIGSNYRDKLLNCDPIATRTWIEALNGDSPIADTNGTTKKMQWARNVVTYPTGAGNGDKYVTIRELRWTTYYAINSACEQIDAYEQNSCHYTPVTQPAYCAFGKLN